MKSKSWKLILLTIIGLTITSQYAFALSIVATYNGSANFGSAAVGYGSGTIWPNPTYPNPPDHQVAVGIGGDNFRTSNLTYDFSSTGNFNTWCVDITHWLQSGTVTYTIGDKGTLASKFNSTRVYDLGKLANEVYSTVDTTEESAAFQLAVWAIMFSDKDITGKYSLNSLTFDAPSTDTGYAQANTWLNGLNTAAVTGNYDITYLYQTSSQDMVVFTSSPVPEPATMLLVGSGLVGLAGLRRKFKK